MSPRQNQTSYSDAVAGAVLISIGTLALIVRLGWLAISLIPQDVLQWWPLLLIVVGVGLWAAEQQHRESSTQEREAKYVR